MANRLLWVGGGLAVLAVAFLVLSDPASEEAAPDWSEPRLGSADAPHEVIYYFDYQCPHCKHFEESPEFEALLADYVEAGDVRITFHVLPVFGPDSRGLAQASQEVWNQDPDAFWTWHTAVFERQAVPDSGWAAKGRILELTAGLELGLDLDALEASFDDRTHAAEAQEDAQQGQRAGVSGTPSLVIDGQAFLAEDTEAVRSALDAMVHAG